MIQRLFQVQTHVKPERPNDDTSPWLVVSNTNALREFPDDLRRYGLRIALHNLWLVLTDTVATPDS